MNGEGENPTQNLDSPELTEIKEYSKMVRTLKPDILSIIATVKNSVRPKTLHEKAGSEFLKMDVGVGPEEGYFPTPKRDVGQYSLDIRSNEEMGKLLKELEVVGPNFKVNKSRLFLELENRNGGNFETDAIGRLVIKMTSKDVTAKSLSFGCNFFLKDKKILDNICVFGNRYRKFFGKELQHENIGNRTPIEFFKRVGEIL